MDSDSSDSTPIALPIRDIDGSREQSGALEAMLNQLAGVIRAYVSPFTSLAYVDYEPLRITEAQLVQAIAGAGYGVDDRHRRFAWRRN